MDFQSVAYLLAGQVVGKVKMLYITGDDVSKILEPIHIAWHHVLSLQTLAQLPTKGEFHSEFQKFIVLLHHGHKPFISLYYKVVIIPYD